MCNIQKIKNMQIYWTDFSALGFEGPAMLATAKNDEGTPWRAIPLIRMHWCVKKRWNVYLSTFQLKGSTMLSKTPKTCSQIMLTSHFPISAGDENFKKNLFKTIGWLHILGFILRNNEFIVSMLACKTHLKEGAC